MFDPVELVNSLSKTARVIDDTDGGNSNPELQAMVGDPDGFMISTFVQFEPNSGTKQIANPLSPLQGDEIFYCYLMEGATFQAHDGSQWNILSYPYQSQIEIENRWYPRLHAWVGINEIRRSIEQWIEPIQQFVPPPPPGVDYDRITKSTLPFEE